MEPLIPRKRPLVSESTMEPVIANKRPLGNAIRCKPEELKNRRTFVQAVRDFPPGCGLNEAEMKASKNLTNIHSNLGKIVDSNLVETNMFNNSKPKELGRNKNSVVSRPVGKVKFWDPRGTKAGYSQKPKVTITYRTQRKKVDSVDPNISKLTSKGKGVDDKLVNSQPIENTKLKSFEPKELGRNKSYLDSRSTCKVKFWDPKCESETPEVATSGVSQMEQNQRKKIQEANAMFVQVYEELSQKNRLKPNCEQSSPFSVTLEVSKIVKQTLKWRDPGKTLGPVYGVQVGDMFNYRCQLVMFGLHCRLQSGIDYMDIGGTNLALSIVDAHRYSNESGSSDTLIYCGQGGHSLYRPKLPPEDQKLVLGNKALKNSMVKKSVVRVIKKIKWFKKDMFVYDGLYNVKACTEDKSAEGKIVFKFHLTRVPGQPLLQKMLERVLCEVS